MDKTLSKLITVCFAAASAILALSVSLLLKAMSGAFGAVARLTDSDVVRHGLPVFIGLALFLYLQLSPKVVVWAQEVALEVKKVVWPSRKDTTAMTIVVLIMVLISSVIITSFDLLSGYFINFLNKVIG